MSCGPTESNLNRQPGRSALELRPAGGKLLGFGRFPSWSALGPQNLVVEGRSGLGEVVQVTDTVTTYTRFPTEVIDIPSDREFLLDPAIIWAERSVWRIYASSAPTNSGMMSLAIPWSITVTSVYGAIRQYDTGSGYHAGVDFDGEPGTGVRGGRWSVVLAEPLQVRGGVVILDHGLGVYSNYFHLLEIAAGRRERFQGPGHWSYGFDGAIHRHAPALGDKGGGIAVDPFEWTRRKLLP